MNLVSLIARFLGPTLGPPGTDRTQVGPMLAPGTLLFVYSMIYLLSHPSLGRLYVFSSFPPPRPPPPPPQWLLLLTSKPFELHLKYLGHRKHRSRKMYWMTFWWPWPKVTAVTLINKNLLVCRIKWEPLDQSLQNLVAIISLVMFITWLDFGGILEEIFFCQIFFENFGCVFSRSNTLLGISQEWLVRLMWNEKEVHRLDTGWTLWPWPLTWHMTLTL